MTKGTKILIALMIIAAAGSLYYSFSHLSFSPKPTETTDKKSEEINQPSSRSTETSATIRDQNSSNFYTLNIEKLGLSAPIILDIDGNNKEQYMKALENGVAQMAKTALPGEIGNTVIFGHSSYYRNKPGNYKTIFAKLNDLARGDKISVTTPDKNLTYNVSEVKIVAPEDLSVVDQESPSSKLTLLTCWPPKTTEQRLVVVANLSK